MSKIPKYKSIPSYAIKYAKRKGKLSFEHEKVFAKDIECAIEYAISIKKERLIEEVENKIFEAYCLNDEVSKLRDDAFQSKGWISNRTINYQKKYLSSFYKYLELVKTIPKNYEEILLKKLDSENLVCYAKITAKRLPKNYEEFILQNSIFTKKISFLVEYSYAIGCKLPEDMHNYLLLYLMQNKENNKNLVLESYFSNLKNIKNQLQKITQVFDKNKSIQEIIDQL